MIMLNEQIESAVASFRALLSEQIARAAEMEKALFGGDFALAAAHILPILAYSVLITVVAVLCFLGQMKNQ